MRRALFFLFILSMTAPLAAQLPSPSDLQDVLRLSVRFYGAQRCGQAHNWLLQENTHGPQCHLEDGPAFRDSLDLTGGWHDAGDHIKFTMTTGFTAFALLKALDAFPTGLDDTDNTGYTGQSNGIPDLLDEVKIATDYLIKIHPDAQTVIARVGGDQDHDYWLTSPYQSTLSEAYGGGQRPVYDNAKADGAGIAAAALAMMCRFYQPYDADYAALCLRQARSLYTYADAHKGTTSEPYYQKSEYRDDLLCAAAELYRSTGETAYLDAAITWHNSRGTHGWVVDWSNHWDYGRHSLIKAGYADALSVWQNDVDRYLGRISQAQYIDGLAFFGNWGSLRYAAGAAFSAALMYDITGETRYLEFTRSQISYILGDNEYNRSFVVGWGENPPTQPHHVNAYGRDNWNWDFSQPPLYTLTGALVGGPTRTATDVSPAGYVDDIEDYVGNEVSIEYNSGLVGSLAALCHNPQTSVDKGHGSEVGIQLMAYPNPAVGSTTLSLHLARSEDVQLRMINNRGQTVRYQQISHCSAGSHLLPFSVMQLSSGLYFIQVSAGNRSTVCKIMVLR